MFTLSKLNIVDFTWSLGPFKSVFIRELHSICHWFKSMWWQWVLSKSRIISLTDKTLITFLSNSFHLFNSWNSAWIRIYFIVVNHWRIHIIFIIYLFRTKDRLFIWNPKEIPIFPFMCWTPASTNTFKPSINWFVVELNWVICFAFKLVRIKVLYNSSLPSGSNWLFTCWTSCEYLNMNHIVSLRSKFGIIVYSRIEYQVSRLHLFKLKVNR